MCVLSWDLTGSKIGHHWQTSFNYNANSWTRKQTKKNNNTKMFRRWFQARMCLLDGGFELRTGLQAAKSECFRDKVTVWCLFFTKADVLPSHKLIKWCRLFSPPDICDLISFEDLNILMPVFPECVREDHFLLLYRITEGNKKREVE